MACLRSLSINKEKPDKWIIVLVLLFNVYRLGETRRPVMKTMKCEQLKIPLCNKIGYNMTYMPNRFNQRSQVVAALEINKFWPLVQRPCAADLKFFLCASFAPICEPHYGRELYPCRSICERVKAGCLPLMKSYGFHWPESLDCSRYPTKGEALCMEHNSSTSDNDDGATTTNKPIQEITTNKIVTKQNNNVDVRTDFHPTDSSVNSVSGFNEVPRVLHKSKSGHGILCGCKCQTPFVYINAANGSVIDGPKHLPSCALPCHSYYFTNDQRRFMSTWLTVISVICLISTLFTFLTYLLDRKRYSYPERPTAFIALCYFMVALGFMVRFLYGSGKVACNPDTNYIRYSATGPTPCMAVFLLIYFFSTAAWLWWVILSLTWFLAAGLKWSEESISSYSRYFHGIAWTVPTIKTMAALAMTAVDGDPVSGICFIGNNNASMLTVFLIAPLLVYLMLGSSFLTAGLLALFHIRRVVKKHHRDDVYKLEQSLSKMGFYALFFIIPSSIVIGCYFYEYNGREYWEKSTNCPCVTRKRSPIFIVYLMKYLMMLLMGISSSAWVIGGNAIAAWTKCFGKLIPSQSNHSNEFNEKDGLAPVAL